MRFLTYIVVTMLLVGCGSETLYIPAQTDIQEINICQGSSNCNIGKSRINDQKVIENALEETKEYSQS